MGACARNMQSDPAEIKPAQCCIKLVFHLTYTMMHGSTKLKLRILLYKGLIFISGLFQQLFLSSQLIYWNWKICPCVLNNVLVPNLPVQGNGKIKVLSSGNRSNIITPMSETGIQEKGKLWKTFAPVSTLSFPRQSFITKGPRRCPTGV